MLPVSAWPPGPPGSSLSPFGPPRCIDVGCTRNGFVLPKGAWVVQTGANQVLMFRPDWRKALYTSPRQQMGTGYLPGQQQWRHGPRPPSFPANPTVYRVNAQVWKDGPPPTTAGRATPEASAQKPSSTAIATAAKPPSPSLSATTGDPCCPPPIPKKRPTHDQALEAWRAWQRKTGTTEPPIMPIPGRVPPNFAGWNFVGAPSTLLIPSFSGGTVLADGQNVVIVGSGFANITEAYSV